MNQNSVRRVIDWTLYAVTIVYLLTGLGITQSRITERLTFGLLSKSFALNIHANLLVPFLALLSIHLLFRPIIQIYSAVRKDRAGLAHKIL